MHDRVDAEDKGIVALLGGLDVDPEQPCSVDIDQAMASGRLRRRLRGVARAGTAVAAVMAISGGVAMVVEDRIVSPGGRETAIGSSSPVGEASSSTGPTSCEVSALPTHPFARQVTVQGGDPTGRYIVGIETGVDGLSYPALWRDGELVTLSEKGHSGTIESIVVNSAGVVMWSVVTTSESGATTVDRQTWRYEAGESERVSSASGFVVRRLRDDGVSYLVNNDPGETTTEDGAPVVMTMRSDGTTSVVSVGTAALRALGGITAVDSDGTSVGVAYASDTATSVSHRAVLWSPDGQAQLLTTPDDSAAASPAASPSAIAQTTLSTEADVIENGWIAGLVTTSVLDADQTPQTSSAASVIRWDTRSGEAVAVAGIQVAQGINRNGWMVGVDSAGGAVAIVGDRVLSLPLVEESDESSPSVSVSVSSPGREDAEGSATYISADGYVLAGTGDGDSAPLLWSCQ